jgi:hypothetical protein
MFGSAHGRKFGRTCTQPDRINRNSNSVTGFLKKDTATDVFLLVTMSGVGSNVVVHM